MERQIQETFAENLKKFSVKYKALRDNGTPDEIFEGIIKPAVLCLIVQKDAVGKSQLNLSSQKDSFILNEGTKDRLLEFLKEEGFRVAVQDNGYNPVIFMIYW
jgi:hypothetical protein